MLAFIFLLGTLFRFMTLADVPHGYDEGYPAFDALRMLANRQPLLTSQPSSVFLDNPPLMAYLQILPLLLWRSIWSVYLFITALNTLAIWLIFRTVRQLLDEPTALLAAFLFAVNPWVVHFSRMPWVQGLLPLLTALIAWGLWPLMVTKKEATLQAVIALLALIVMSLSYIVGIVMVAPVAFLSFVYRRQMPRKLLYGGALILFAGFLLFRIGLTQKETRNSNRLQSFIADTGLSIDSVGFEHALRLVTGLDYESQVTTPEESWLPPALSRAASGLLAVGFLAGLVRAGLALRENDERRRLAVVLLVWFLTPVAGFLFLPYLVHPHYLLFSLPAGHVLAAWGMALLFRRRGWQQAGMVVLLAAAVLFGLNIYRVGQAVAANPPIERFTGLALADAARVGATIRALSSGDSFPRRLAAADNAPMLSSLSATYVDTMPELQFPNFMLLPGQEPLLYVLRNQPPEPLGLGAHEEWFPENTVRLANDANVTFLRILPYERDQALGLPQTIVDWRSDAGLTLLGYTQVTPPAPQAGQSLILTTYWRVEELHPDRGEWFVTPYTQLLNLDWQMWANVSAEGQWGYRWQVGDIYLQRQTIPLPNDLEPGEYQLLLGLINAIDETNFGFQAPAGPAPFFLIPLTVR